jgi:hypothetical protein|uniref:Uncharacterized protein n=1 Tax=viral metagenome TaxID=1070528 RepID=A0A6C0IP84_9ZZZZ
MNFQPQQQPITNSVQMTENVRNVGDSISSSILSATDSIKDSVSGFSDQAQASMSSTAEMSPGFMQSNTLFAKFAFVILIVIVFMFLLSLGIMLIQYFLSPSSNPYLVKGMVDGNIGITIPQDPGNNESILIERSNNEESGLEFTWSSWIYVDELKIGDEYQMFQHIFHKGNDSYDVDGVATVSNGPGLYLKQKVGTDASAPNTASIYVIMDTKTGKTNNSENALEVQDIPIKKWVNVVIRMKNTVLEVYVNGVVSGRLQFRELPIQNYYDVNVGKNGGITGKLSNLRYYKEALTIFDINNIVATGPDIRTFRFDVKKMNDYNYLSNMWYTNKLY